MKLEDIFVVLKGKQLYSYQELYTLEVKPEFVNQLSYQLGLNFDESVTEENVCFANGKEVRPEYRITFNKFDIINYIQALFPGKKVLSTDTEVVFPKDSNAFWIMIAS